MSINSTPVSIAPAASWRVSFDQNANGQSPEGKMMYACQNCSKRKIKCDKMAPICAACTRGKHECVWQAPPPPRRRKRKFSEDDRSDKLAQYEKILQEHGLLPAEDVAPPSPSGTPQEAISLRFLEAESARTGKLLAGHDRSRFINSNIWRNFGDDEIHQISDEDEDQPDFNIMESYSIDPLTSAFMGSQQSTQPFHPSHPEAMLLWETHVDRVEPICKILHLPSTAKMVERASQYPQAATKAEECLLFAIYHFGVFSMTDDETMRHFGESKPALLKRYHLATRQALVNASFLRTTEMPILQALVLFLLPGKFFYDAHTHWILTGVALRIAQRMGLHRDGEKLGLPPFDVQMRRRLFFQIIPLDGGAAQISGTGISITSWDTEAPLNLDDDQIWPGMTEVPKEQNGATDMMFCMARSCMGKHFSSNAGKHYRDYNEAEPLIDQAESEVQDKFIRYCDMVNPLHYLTICQARSGISAMRLRVRMPKVRNKTATNEERREILQLAQKILDQDIAACGNANLKKYLWHIQSFFAWGSWDSLIFLITTLRRADLLTESETNSAWNRVEQVYNNRNLLIETRKALPVALGRVALKAWNANPATDVVAEPAFITKLRSRQKVKGDRNRIARPESAGSSLGVRSDSISSSTGPSPSSDAVALFASGMNFDISKDFNLDNADWEFWDQLMQNERNTTLPWDALPGEL